MCTERVSTRWWLGQQPEPRSSLPQVSGPWVTSRWQSVGGVFWAQSSLGQEAVLVALSLTLQMPTALGPVLGGRARGWVLPTRGAASRDVPGASLCLPCVVQPPPLVTPKGQAGQGWVLNWPSGPEFG